MDIDDLKQILIATHERGNKQWITPAGAILDVFSDLIKAGKLSDGHDLLQIRIQTAGYCAGLA